MWSNVSDIGCVAYAGLEVTFRGNPGHGLAFITNNAAEKLVSISLRYVDCFHGYSAVALSSIVL